MIPVTAPDLPSGNFDPDWLARNGFAQVQAEGLEGDNPPWITQLYAWVHKRRTAQDHASSPLPRPVTGVEWNPHREGYFPLLWSDGPSGRAGVSFLHIWPAPAAPHSAQPLSAQERSAQAAWRWGRENIGVNELAGFPEDSRMRILHRPAVDGESDSLAALVACLALQTGFSGDDVCASGGWDKESDCLAPVEAFQEKVAAAGEWGYRRLFFVEGQAGIPTSTPGLELIQVPANPEGAARVVRDHLQPKSVRVARNFGRGLEYLCAGVLSVIAYELLPPIRNSGGASYDPPFGILALALFGGVILWWRLRFLAAGRRTTVERIGAVLLMAWIVLTGGILALNPGEAAARNPVYLTVQGIWAACFFALAIAGWWRMLTR